MFLFPSFLIGTTDFACFQHTIIIDDVPILPLNLKNEARRLITLLDALCAFSFLPSFSLSH